MVTSVSLIFPPLMHPRCHYVYMSYILVDGYISGRCTLNCVRDSAIEMVNHKFLLIQSINLWWWEVGDPVSQNRSISPLQQNSQATPEVVDRLALFLSRVPGKRRTKFLDLPLPFFFILIYLPDETQLYHCLFGFNV